MSWFTKRMAIRHAIGFTNLANGRAVMKARGYATAVAAHTLIAACGWQSPKRALETHKTGGYQNMLKGYATRVAEGH